MPKYDFLIVGAGLFGATFSYQMTQAGKRCLVIDQRSHIGGNCYTENQDGILIHRYGAHIFHTSNETVWNFITQFGEFNNFINQPISMVNGIPYNLPFNMNLFSKFFGITKPEEMIEIFNKDISEHQIKNPKNMEEQAINLIGEKLYRAFIKGYSEKQWGRECKDLPVSYLKRLPIRFTYDNNYFNDIYQGIPKKGYTDIFDKLLDRIEFHLNTKFDKGLIDLADKVIYTGMIDEYFDYCYGSPEYRSLKFVDIKKRTVNYQGCAVINYPDTSIPYTRSIEHRHFNPDTISGSTIISYEFPIPYEKDKDLIPYYPMGDSRNQKTYDKYLALARQRPNIVFAGRLGSYQYYDMDDTIEAALNLSQELL